MEVYIIGNGQISKSYIFSEIIFSLTAVLELNICFFRKLVGLFRTAPPEVQNSSICA